MARKRTNLEKAEGRRAALAMTDLSMHEDYERQDVQDALSEEYALRAMTDTGTALYHAAEMETRRHEGVLA